MVEPAGNSVRSLAGAVYCSLAVSRIAAQQQAPSTNGPAALADIRDLKPIVEIPGAYAWLWWTLAALAIAGACWWLWKRSLRRRTAPVLNISIPPHRKAKDRLRGAHELYSDPYAFCSLVSDVVRTYLEERFDLHAPDRTTEEFLDELRFSTQLLPAHKSLLETFLGLCDLVKFARHEPNQEELRALLESALRLIDDTSPAASSGQPATSKAA